MANYKRFINFSIASLVIASAVFFFGKPGWFPGFYMPKFMGAASLISALLIFLPPLIFRPADENKKMAIIKLQSYLSFALLLNGLGSLGLFQLYRYGIPYDKLLHFSIPLMSTMWLTEFMREWWGLNFKKTVAIAAFLMMASGAGWEVLEFLSDFIFKTKSFGIYGKYITKDTITDIIFNTAGIISGVSILLRNRDPKNKEITYS